jgi:hypothetical protein
MNAAAYVLYGQAAWEPMVNTVSKKIYPVPVGILGWGSIYTGRFRTERSPVHDSTPLLSPRGDRGPGSVIIPGPASGC